MTFAPDIVAQIDRDVSAPVLETARLRLRAPRREDAKALAALANEFRVAVNTARLPHPYRVHEAEEFIAAANSREGEACFVVTRDGRLIGACSVDPREEGPELGYWFGVSFWGRGYATEAARALVDYAFGDLGCETLHSGARVSNPASRRVLEKCAQLDVKIVAPGHGLPSSKDLLDTQKRYFVELRQQAICRS